MDRESYGDAKQVADAAILRTNLVSSENNHLVQKEEKASESYLERLERNSTQEASFDAIETYLEKRTRNSAMNGSMVELEAVMPDGTSFTYNPEGFLENGKYDIKAVTSYEILQRVISEFGDVGKQKQADTDLLEVMVQLAYQGQTDRR